MAKEVPEAGKRFMPYPIPEKQRGATFIIALALTIIVGRLMRVDLKTEAAPRGIISLELAGTEAQARAILASWEAGDGRMRRDAFFNLGLDFLFLINYSTSLSLGCVWAAQRARGLPATFGLWLAWSQWLAGLLDTVENLALLQMVRGNITAPWPRLARWCAIPKFLLVLAGLIYIVLLGGGSRLAARLALRRTE